MKFFFELFRWSKTSGDEKFLQEDVSKYNKTFVVVADYLPLFDQQSGGLRLTNIMRSLCEIGYTVHFVSMLKEGDLPGDLRKISTRQYYENNLKKNGIKSVVYGKNEFIKLIKKFNLEIDFAFISFPNVAKEFLPFFRNNLKKTKIIYDMVDLHFLRLEREGNLLNDFCKLKQAALMKNLEMYLANEADIVIAISPEEKKIILELVPTSVVEVIPNFFDVEERDIPSVESRSDVLFLGGFWHKPNIDAVEWFTNTIWPLIYADVPNSQFLIAGSNPNDRVYDLEKIQGVKVLGYISDLNSIFDRARVFVAPLRFGAGVKGKVVQSMINGLPTVLTEVGAEGLDLTNQNDALITDNPSIFANHVVRLLKDDELWKYIQSNALSKSRVRYSMISLKYKLIEIFDE